MRNIQRQNCVFRHLFPIGIGILLFPGVGWAGIEDSRFTTSSDGTAFEFELREVSRRQVLDRLFADQAIKLDWADPAVAGDLISGSYHGSLSQIARLLLTKLNFVLVHERTDDEIRITRVVILGRSSGQASPGLATLQAALRAAEKPKSAFPASPGDPTRMSRAAAGPSTTVPAGAARSTLSRDGDAARSAAPVPIATSGPPQVPVARPAPADLVPLPIMTALPSVAPIAGAALPELPGPNSTRAGK